MGYKRSFIFFSSVSFSCRPSIFSTSSPSGVRKTKPGTDVMLYLSDSVFQSEDLSSILVRFILFSYFFSSSSTMGFCSPQIGQVSLKNSITVGLSEGSLTGGPQDIVLIATVRMMGIAIKKTSLRILITPPLLISVSFKIFCKLFSILIYFFLEHS